MNMWLQIMVNVCQLLLFADVERKGQESKEMNGRKNISKNQKAKGSERNSPT